MARRTIVKVDKDKANYLERLNYELRMTKDIIQRLIEAHPNDADIINGEAFKAYHKQAVELEAEYNIAVEEIGRLYVPEALKSHQYRWTIPNNSDDMIIDVLCNCKIEGIE